MENVKIDIIIPCYNSHSTIDRCLGSVLSQNVLNSCTVTLVRDGGDDYDEVVKRYSPVMNIREIGYDENRGPAYARNFGIDNTENELIMFIDSDDALANVFSIVVLVNQMFSDPDNVICIGTFLEEVAPFQFKTHNKDTSFVHGKMYRRSYLNKYGIRAKEDSRCNEDVGFNILSLLMLGEHEKVTYSDIPVAYWLFNPNSTVRKDKANYDRSTSFRGFAENLTYVFEELNKRGKGFEPQILLEKATTMQRLYLLYKERTIPQFEKGNYAVVKAYYKKIYKEIEHLINEDSFNHVYKTLPYVGDEKSNKKAVKKFIKALNS